MTGTVTLASETFAVAESISRMAVLQYAKAESLTGEERGTLLAVAQYDLLQQVIADDDWNRFQQAANKARCTDEALWDVVDQAFKVFADRPTSRSVDSSDGPSSSAPSSTSAPEDGAPDPQEMAQAFPGRPDLQVLALRQKTA